MAIQEPAVWPSNSINLCWASPSSSTREIYTMTPPDNPRAKVSAFVSVLFMKKAMKPPMPVARPASVVSRKTTRMWSAERSMRAPAGQG